MAMKKRLLVWTWLVGWGVLFALGANPLVQGAAKPVGQNDGITVLKLELQKGLKLNYCYLTLVLKNGYANDPAGNSGLTFLTNQLLYRAFLNTSALDVRYETYANFSQFYFLIPLKEYAMFCKELDAIIRMEALMMYDECHAIIQGRKNEPQNPAILGLMDLYKMLYGNDHPYLSVFQGNLPNLDINTVNDWFRKTYRPSNMIIAATADLPGDFLMKPSGRDLKSPVAFTRTPPALCPARPMLHWTQIEGNISSVFVGLPGPALHDKDCFSMMVLRRFLQKELWEKLREEMGLCYDVQVRYSYLRESMAPSLIISLETLPADADIAIAKIIDVLLQVTDKNGVTAQRLSLIQEQEKSRAGYQNNSIFQQLDGLVYETMFTAPWLKDSKQYLKNFNTVTADDLAKLVAARIKFIKISVARPNSDTGFEETGKALGKLEKMGQTGN